MQSAADRSRARRNPRSKTQQRKAREFEAWWAMNRRGTVPKLRERMLSLAGMMPIGQAVDLALKLTAAEVGWLRVLGYA